MDPMWLKRLQQQLLVNSNVSSVAEDLRVVPILPATHLFTETFDSTAICVGLTTHNQVAFVFINF